MHHRCCSLRGATFLETKETPSYALAGTGMRKSWDAAAAALSASLRIVFGYVRVEARAREVYTEGTLRCAVSLLICDCICGPSTPGGDVRALRWPHWTQRRVGVQMRGQKRLSVGGQRET